MRNWYKQGLVSALLCIVVWVLLTNIDMFSSFNETWIDRDIRNNGMQGAIYFMLVGATMTACGAPRQLLAFLGGYSFGAVMGVFLSTLATLLGCVMAFYFSRLIIRPFIKRRFASKLSGIDAFLTQQPTCKTIIIRLLPIGSNVLTNCLAGSTGVKPSAFFIGSLIGYVPQMIVFALLGKGLLIGSEWKIIVSFVMLLVSSYISFSLYKKYKAQTSFIETPDDDHQIAIRRDVS
jgi:uncharacterized membrane protein YdjX (TVP38/TMEM64 family)